LVFQNELFLAKSSIKPSFSLQISVETSTRFSFQQKSRNMPREIKKTHLSSESSAAIQCSKIERLKRLTIELAIGEQALVRLRRIQRLASND